MHLNNSAIFFCSLLEGIRTKVFLTLSAFKFACVPVEIKVIHSLNTSFLLNSDKCNFLY